MTKVDTTGVGYPRSRYYMVLVLQRSPFWDSVQFGWNRVYVKDSMTVSGLSLNLT